MGHGILLSGGAEVDFNIHGVFQYSFFGHPVWITTSHICILIVMLLLVAFAIAANRCMAKASQVPGSFQNVVEADGSVYPCDFYVLDQYRLGNLREDNFGRLQERRKEICFVEDSFQRGEECGSCRYFPVCRGGCRRHREQQGGGNYFCQSYRMFFDACLPRMAEIARSIR